MLSPSEAAREEYSKLDAELLDAIIKRFLEEYPRKFRAGSSEHGPKEGSLAARRDVIKEAKNEVHDLVSYLHILEERISAAVDLVQRVKQSLTTYDTIKYDLLSYEERSVSGTPKCTEYLDRVIDLLT